MATMPEDRRQRSEEADRLRAGPPSGAIAIAR